MKATINRYAFIDAFKHRPNNFTYDGLVALYDYLTELESELDHEIELDPIAICCEYREYKDLEEFQNDYSGEYETMHDIEENTSVIYIDDERFIIESF